MIKWLNGASCLSCCSETKKSKNCDPGATGTHTFNYSEPGNYTFDSFPATVYITMRASGGGGAGAYVNPLGFGSGGGGGGGGELLEKTLFFDYPFTMETVVGEGGKGGRVNENGAQGGFTQVFSRYGGSNPVQNFLELQGFGGKGGDFMSRGGDGAGGGGGGGVLGTGGQGGTGLFGGGNGANGGNPNGGKGGSYNGVPGANGGQGTTAGTIVLGGGGGGTGGDTGTQGQGGGIQPGSPNGSAGFSGAPGAGGGGGAVYFPGKSPSGYPGGAGGGAQVSITVVLRSN